MNIKDYLNFFRWPNLVIIIISMVFIHWFVILPLLGINTALNIVEFSLLIFSVITITSAGYVINDYFDIDTDYINKPGKNKVGNIISEKKAMNIYYFLSAVGIVAGLILSWLVKEINFTLIFLFIAGILWYYSERYKCIPLMGNIVVAILSAISFGIVWQYDFFALKNHPVLFSTAQSNFLLVTKFILIYMSFATLSSFLREMIKDMEDYSGDKKVGCRTFAVSKGIKKAKIIAIITSILLFIFLLWAQILFYKMEFYYLFGYFILMELFLIIIMIKTKEAGDIVDFSNLSGLTKLFMLLGILSMILVRFET